MRRRARRGAGGALRQPEQLPARRAAGWPTSCARREPTACSSPTSGTTSTTARRTTSRPARRSGSETGGKVDGFICAVGTGGTLAGVSSYLREKKRDIVIAVADPRGAAMYDLLHARRGEGVGGRLDHRRHRARARHADHRRHHGRRGLPHPRRGGGADRLRPPGARGPVPRRLLRHQRRRRDPAGAASLGPGHTIVTVLCDYGTRYQSKLFNPEFLRSKGLPVPAWLERGSGMKPALV